MANPFSSSFKENATIGLAMESLSDGSPTKNNTEQLLALIAQSQIPSNDLASLEINSY
tara:strand:+ start:464 stop:637 length:174 start_codon:yes stop_codon:yes gene_type:complete